MQATHVRPLARSAAVALLSLAAACGTDPAGIAAPEGVRPSGLRLDVIPTPADVVIALDGGTFHPFTADNSRRDAPSEFWDNPSADDRPPADVGCNVGFFASATIKPGCGDAAAGSYENRGGYTQFLGKNGGTTPAAFMFDGTGRYALKLEGSYAFLASEVGYFYKNDAGAYVFEPLGQFSARQVNSTFTMTPTLTGGRNWGFYIRNNFNPEDGGCRTPDTDCSDATGGYAGKPPQQFALFLNADGTKYLVGAEDNKLELLPDNTFRRDSDNNDYMISVTPVARGGFGCSPGFWKNARDRNWDLAGYARTTLFDDVFDDAFPGKTLQQVLELNGGGLNALGRHTVAALLNASALDDDYEFSPSGVIARFNAVHPENPAGYEAAKAEFEQYIDTNGRSCPLNNGGGRS